MIQELCVTQDPTFEQKKLKQCTTLYSTKKAAKLLNPCTTFFFFKKLTNSIATAPKKPPKDGFGNNLHIEDVEVQQPQHPT